jgi:hypothetical protein
MTSNDQCRICFEEDGDLITPCYCKGTMKFVHRNCLNKWRAVAPNSTFCENCKYNYKLLNPKFHNFHYLFILTITIFLYTGMIFFGSLLNDSVFPVLEMVSTFSDSIFGISRKEYYKETRRGFLFSFCLFFLRSF